MVYHIYADQLHSLGLGILLSGIPMVNKNDGAASKIDSGVNGINNQNMMNN